MNNKILLTFLLVYISSPVLAEERVTIDNFKRAESDYYFKMFESEGMFGKLVNEREPKPVDKQTVIRLNRDTLYTGGIFDLTSPVTITKPDSGKRFQSLVVISEDHFVKFVSYKSGSYTFTKDKIGTRYAMVGFRTFVDPNDPKDVAEAHALQDKIEFKQKDAGKFEIPDWNQAERKRVHDLILELSKFSDFSTDSFGDINEVNPLHHLIGTAIGWGGNPVKDAVYSSITPKENDGKTSYTLSVKDVPVDAFWSITVYNQKGYYEAPESAISVNSVTAKKNTDNSVTIHFGGDEKQANYLRIMPGWNYTVRLYKPRKEIISGKWKFPEAVPVR